MKYKAFLSCHHESDGDLASVLKSSLQRFARPRYRLRALRINLGRSDPHLKHGLRQSTHKALDQSRFFLLLANPQAAASIQVQKELEIWLKNNSVETVLIVLTGGELYWGAATGQFDWTRTTALPECLKEKFRHEPLYVDLRWAIDEKHLSLNHTRFQSAVADIAATLHGKPKDQLTGEDVRQHQKVIRATSAATVCLLLLTAFTVAFSYYAILQSTQAELRLANSLTDNAAAKQQAGEWRKSRDLASAAKKLLEKHDHSSFEANLKIWKSYNYAPPPLIVRDSSGLLMTFSPDREHGLAVREKSVELFDLKTMRTLGTYLDSPQDIMSIWFSPKGEYVLVENNDHTLDLWDHEAGQVIQTLIANEARLNWATIDHDGRFAISITSDHRTIFWDLQSGEIQHELDRGELIVSAAFTPDGEAVLTGSKNGQLVLWETRSGSKISVLGKAGVLLKSVAVSNNGQYALSGGELLVLWDLKSGRKLKQFTHISPPVWLVAFSKDDNYVVASMGGHEPIVRAWNTHSGQFKAAFSGNSPSLQECALSPYGVGLLHQDQEHDYFSVQTDELSMLRFPAHEDAIMRIDFSPDGRLLTAIDFNGAHGIWDVATGYELNPLPFKGRRLSRALFLGGGEKIAYGAVDGTVGIVDLVSEQEILSFQAHRGPIMYNNLEYGVVNLAVSPDGQRALTIGMDKTAKLWRIQSGHLITSIDLQRIPLHSSFINDGTKGLITTMTTLILWDFETGLISELDEDIGGLVLAVSPDGKNICTSGSGSTYTVVKNLNLKQPAKSLSHIGHSFVVSGCDYSPDGVWLASTSYDGSLRFWETGNGRQFVGIELDNPLMSVRFSPDGMHLAVGRSTGQLQIWRLGRPNRYAYYEPEVARAIATLSEDPKHLASLELLGRWYAFRGLWRWSAELFEEARQAGGEIPSLPLARAYWSLGRYDDARCEYQHAMEREEAPAYYLQLCQKAIEAYKRKEF